MNVGTSSAYFLGFPAEPDLEPLGALRFRHKAQQPLAFIGQGVAIRFGESFELLDHERHLSAGTLRLPRSAGESVEQHAAHHGVLEESLAVLI